MPSQPSTTQERVGALDLHFRRDDVSRCLRSVGRGWLPSQHDQKYGSDADVGLSASRPVSGTVSALKSSGASGRGESKTPLFQAMNAERYQRQALIREIEIDTGNHLICYVAGIAAPVDREDVLCFVDLLHNIPGGENVDLTRCG